MLLSIYLSVILFLFKNLSLEPPHLTYFHIWGLLALIYTRKSFPRAYSHCDHLNLAHDGHLLLDTMFTAPPSPPASTHLPEVESDATLPKAEKQLLESRINFLEAQTKMLMSLRENSVHLRDSEEQAPNSQTREPMLNTMYLDDLEEDLEVVRLDDPATPQTEGPEKSKERSGVYQDWAAVGKRRLQEVSYDRQRCRSNSSHICLHSRHTIDQTAL